MVYFKFIIICLLMLIFYVSNAKAKLSEQKVISPQCCDDFSYFHSGPPVCLNYSEKTFSPIDGKMILLPEIQFEVCENGSVVDFNTEENTTGVNQDGLSPIKSGTEYYRYSFNATCTNGYHYDMIVVNVCKDNEDEPRSVFISCLIISTFCFFFAVVMHTVVLNVQETHKKIFVGYCLCMGATFICLILFQFINTNCNYLGSFFFVFILASFVWISCLCLDLVYLIRNFAEKENKERLIAYVACAVALPLALLLISIVPSGVPDIPKLFVNGREKCEFHKGSDDGTTPLLLFIPVGLLIMASVGFLFYSWYLIRNNDVILKNDITWLEKCNSFKYTMKSYCLLLLLSSIWTVGAILQFKKVVNLLVFEFIEGLQGIFVLAIFVFNRYTRRQIREAVFTKKEGTEIPSTRFNGLIERFKSTVNRRYGSTE